MNHHLYVGVPPEPTALAELLAVLIKADVRGQRAIPAETAALLQFRPVQCDLLQEPLAVALLGGGGAAELVRARGATLGTKVGVAVAPTGALRPFLVWGNGSIYDPVGGLTSDLYAAAPQVLLDRNTGIVPPAIALPGADLPPAALALPPLGALAPVSVAPYTAAGVPLAGLPPELVPLVRGAQHPATPGSNLVPCVGLSALWATNTELPPLHLALSLDDGTEIGPDGSSSYVVQPGCGGGCGAS